MRSFYIGALGIAALTGVGYGSLGFPPRLLVWNASASMPRGLYRKATVGPMERGNTVLVWLPRDMRDLAAEREYLPLTVPAIKPIAAVSGDRVCAVDDEIIVNEKAVAHRHAVDGTGRKLPHWTGCKTLQTGEVFLLSTYADDSFDGRYFGPTNTADIIEKVMLLWTF